MKHYFSAILFALLANYADISLKAQELPQDFSIAIGGGLAVPSVDGNKNDFFSKHGNRLGYDLMLDTRYYLTPDVSLGVQYDYVRTAKKPDKMHVHFIRPTITLRHLWSNDKQGAFLSLGIGYMDYRERTYEGRNNDELFFQKGYCALSLALGYEFAISKNLSGVLRADVLTADWFANPDARLFNPDGYDDGIDHHWFKNNITFLNIGFAIQIGK